MEIEEQVTAFQVALIELHDRIKVVQTSKGSEPEFIDLLKEDLQETRRNENFALEEQWKSRDDADERFGHRTSRLKTLETTEVVGPSGPACKSSDGEDEIEDRTSCRDRSRKAQSRKQVLWERHQNTPLMMIWKELRIQVRTKVSTTRQIVLARKSLIMRRRSPEAALPRVSALLRRRVLTRRRASHILFLMTSLRTSRPGADRPGRA